MTLLTAANTYAPVRGTRFAILAIAGPLSSRSNKKGKKIESFLIKKPA
jgi:hypothetical protein